MQDGERIVYAARRGVAALYLALAGASACAFVLVATVAIDWGKPVDVVFGVLFLLCPLAAAIAVLVIHTGAILATRIVLEPWGIDARTPRTGGMLYLGAPVRRRLPWEAVTAVVLRPRVYGVAPALSRVDEFAIETADGALVLTRTFVARPAEIAREIARRAGVALVERGVERRAWPGLD